MKVLIATGLYPPEIGGPATYAAMLEKELPARHIDVSILPFGWVRRYPKIIRHVAFAWKVWRESQAVDVIYALDPISVGLPAWLVAKLRGKRFFLRLGGDYAWEQGRLRFGLTSTLDEYTAEKATASLPVKLLASIQSFVAQRAEYVIVPSEYLGSVVETWSVPTEKIRVIYSALYPLQVGETKETLKKQLNLTTPTIVSAGRLVPWKGFGALLEVVAALKDTYPNLTLVIVGDGEDRTRLEQLAAKLQLNKHLRFTGSISKEALGATIKAADVFVLNTAYEGLSHQLIEVMDLGTPIVTTAVGGNTELITDGIEGFLVEFNHRKQLAEAITTILENKETQARMIQSARGRSKDFSKEKVVREIMTLLQPS